MEIGFIIGTILLFIGGGIWYNLNRKEPISEKDENTALFGFAISYIGIWFFIIFGTLSLFKREMIPIKLNLLSGSIIGAITGLVAGTINFAYWISEEKFEKKQTPEEAIGGTFLGCFGAIFSVLFGIVIGALIGKFWG